MAASRPDHPAGGGRPAAPELPARVAVLGLGLMGGSLVRALKALDRPPVVVGWSPERAEAESAAALGALDEVAHDPGAAAASADLVVYATPPAAVLDLLERHRDVWREGALVTDLASLRAPVREAVLRLGIGDRHAGSHPMAGGEGSGFGASRPDLYRGARVWLTGTNEATLGALTRFWSALGARPRPVTEDEHDRAMVLLSHLPQLVSNALALEMERGGARRDELGSGGRDMTRLAASSPALWRELLGQGAPGLAGALRGVAGALEELAALLEAGEVERIARIMERTSAWAAAAAEVGGAPASGAPARVAREEAAP